MRSNSVLEGLTSALLNVSGIEDVNIYNDSAVLNAIACISQPGEKTQIIRNLRGSVLVFNTWFKFSTKSSVSGLGTRVHSLTLNL